MCIHVSVCKVGVSRCLLGTVYIIYIYHVYIALNVDQNRQCEETAL